MGRKEPTSTSGDAQCVATARTASPDRQSEFLEVAFSGELNGSQLALEHRAEPDVLPSYPIERRGRSFARLCVTRLRLASVLPLGSPQHLRATSEVPDSIASESSVIVRVRRWTSH